MARRGLGEVEEALRMHARLANASGHTLVMPAEGTPEASRLLALTACTQALADKMGPGVLPAMPRAGEPLETWISEWMTSLHARLNALERATSRESASTKAPDGPGSTEAAPAAPPAPSVERVGESPKPSASQGANASASRKRRQQRRKALLKQRKASQKLAVSGGQTAAPPTS